MCKDNTGLSEFRNDIDRIDKEMVKLFEERIETVLKVAEYKKEHNMQVLQKGREDEVLKKAVSNLKNKGYSDDVIEFMNFLMKISRNIQDKKLDK